MHFELGHPSRKIPRYPALRLYCLSCAPSDWRQKQVSDFFCKELDLERLLTVEKVGQRGKGLASPQQNVTFCNLPSFSTIRIVWRVTLGVVAAG